MENEESVALTGTFLRMEVDRILGSLSITDDFDQLVDVTCFFDELCSKLKPETIVKDPRFDLFEGTHSLEADNSKLDSSPIELTDEELEFDLNVAHESPLSSVTAIADRLLRCVIMVKRVSNLTHNCIEL